MFNSFPKTKRYRRSNFQNKRCGRGQKGTGQRNRGRSKVRLQSGGQNPFYRMHGKIGLATVTKSYKIFNAVMLKNRLGSDITVQKMIAARMIKPSWKARYPALKILGPGTFDSVESIILLSGSVKCNNRSDS